MNWGFVSPKALTPCSINGGKSKSKEVKQLKKPVKSSPIPIDLKGGDTHGSGKKGSPSPYRETMSFSELWAGPAYSNSPPPSSLPMHKFSLKPIRTVSPELPTESNWNLQPLPKSAPAFPSRVSAKPSFSYLCGDDSASNHRILNLDNADE